MNLDKHLDKLSLPALLALLAVTLAAMAGVGWAYWEASRHLSLTVFITVYMVVNLGFEIVKSAVKAHKRRQRRKRIDATLFTYFTRPPRR